ncbi:hypothetical protein CGC48_10955 [Capnocytophaga cynodegmi]|uniref:Uncharacterized protein n=1 Tax=Capnocytophaga cynodegmi TaxID=28189 RepID=A0A250E800_9FLAO|nr:hypothetical protein [Capnocytophaga cynodegmi]ATA69090.1 hypothetical protein CGC48_10955 [Capnocytophaga cynodegmi]
MKNSNSLGSFVWGVIVVFVALLTGIVWYLFQYWYIIVGAVVLWITYIIIKFEVRNHRKFNKERQKLLDKKRIFINSFFLSFHKIPLPQKEYLL